MFIRFAISSVLNGLNKKLQTIKSKVKVPSKALKTHKIVYFSDVSYAYRSLNYVAIDLNGMTYNGDV